jgi:hypothetical protein
MVYCRLKKTYDLKIGVIGDKVKVQVNPLMMLSTILGGVELSESKQTSTDRMPTA